MRAQEMCLATDGKFAPTISAGNKPAQKNQTKTEKWKHDTS